MEFVEELIPDLPNYPGWYFVEEDPAVVLHASGFTATSWELSLFRDTQKRIAEKKRKEKKKW